MIQSISVHLKWNFILVFISRWRRLFGRGGSGVSTGYDDHHHHHHRHHHRYHRSPPIVIVTITWGSDIISNLNFHCHQCHHCDCCCLNWDSLSSLIIWWLLLATILKASKILRMNDIQSSRFTKKCHDTYITDYVPTQVEEDQVDFSRLLNISSNKTDSLFVHHENHQPTWLFPPEAQKEQHSRHSMKNCLLGGKVWD